MLVWKLDMRTVNYGLMLLASLGLIFSSHAALAKPPSANLDLVRQLNAAFVEVAERVSPAVVVITVIEKATAIPVTTRKRTPRNLCRANSGVVFIANHRSILRKELRARPPALSFARTVTF